MKAEGTIDATSVLTIWKQPRSHVPSEINNSFLVKVCFFPSTFPFLLYGNFLRRSKIELTEL
jgi:hypothetical protein